MADGTNAMIAIGHRQGDTLGHGSADQQNGWQRLAFVNSFQVRIDMRFIPRKEWQITRAQQVLCGVFAGLCFAQCSQ